MPAYLIGLANKISRGASRIYLKLFGVGIIEWRILSVLSIEGESSANMICDQIDLDKAAASRSVRVLQASGYIALTVDPKDTRKRLLQLTPSGQDMHDRILDVALTREQHLLRGFNPDEIGVLIGYLKRLAANAETMDDLDYGRFAKEG